MYSRECPKFSSEQFPKFPTIAEGITFTSEECPEIHSNFSYYLLKTENMSK